MNQQIDSLSLSLIVNILHAEGIKWEGKTDKNDLLIHLQNQTVEAIFKTITKNKLSSQYNQAILKIIFVLCMNTHKNENEIITKKINDLDQKMNDMTDKFNVLIDALTLMTATKQ